MIEYPQKIEIDDLSETDRNMVVAAKKNSFPYFGMVYEGGLFIDTIHATRPLDNYQNPGMVYYRYDERSQDLVRID